MEAAENLLSSASTRYKPSPSASSITEYRMQAGVQPPSTPKPKPEPQKHRSFGTDEQGISFLLQAAESLEKTSLGYSPQQTPPSALRPIPTTPSQSPLFIPKQDKSNDSPSPCVLQTPRTVRPRPAPPAQLDPSPVPIAGSPGDDTTISDISELDSPPPTSAVSVSPAYARERRAARRLRDIYRAARLVRFPDGRLVRVSEEGMGWDAQGGERR